MDCEICRNNKSKRTISGISMCEDCFSKIAALRNNDVKAIAFLKNPDNLKNASENANTYIQSLINSKENLYAEIKAAEQQMEVEKQKEQKKQIMPILLMGIMSMMLYSLKTLPPDL